MLILGTHENWWCTKMLIILEIEVKKVVSFLSFEFILVIKCTYTQLFISTMLFLQVGFSITLT